MYVFALDEIATASGTFMSVYFPAPSFSMPYLVSLRFAGPQTKMRWRRVYIRLLQ